MCQIVTKTPQSYFLKEKISYSLISAYIRAVIKLTLVIIMLLLEFVDKANLQSVEEQKLRAGFTYAKISHIITS